MIVLSEEDKDILELDNRIHSNGCIVCPYCRYQEEDLDFASLTRDGDECLLKCPECSESFKVTLSISYVYITEK